MITATIKQSKRSDWRMRFGEVTLVPSEDFKVPNRFQRWMHKVCFGFIWEKIDDTKTTY